MNKLPLIIDCDPGIDDAVALLLLYKHKERFDIKLMSSCSGNLSINTTTNNLCFFAKHFFDNAPVASGYGKPLQLKFEAQASDVHGQGGLGNFSIDQQDYPILPDLAHIEMYKVLRDSDEPVTIMALGPMTNIALLLTDFPEIKSKIKQIHCMVGSVGGKGNIKPYAEFNAYYDPHAFKIVAESGVPFVMNPIEVGVNTCLEKKIIKKSFENTKFNKMLKDLVLGLNEPGNPLIVCLFDANSSLALIHPKLYNFIPCEAMVSIEQDSLGQCFCIQKEVSSCYYIEAKDIETVKDYLIEELQK